MSVRVTDNTSSVFGKIQQGGSLFLRMMAEQIVSISEPNTPKKEGFLRRDVIKQVLGLHGKVIWTKKYAIYQEEKQFANYTTPGTGPHFAKNAVNEAIKDTATVAKKSGLI